MRALWHRWVAFTGRPIDTRPLAMVRIGVALCLLLDLLRVAWLGLVPVLFWPWLKRWLDRGLHTT